VLLGRAKRDFAQGHQYVSYGARSRNSATARGFPPAKKEARPIGPGKPDALRRNIGENSQKTMIILVVMGPKFAGHDHGEPGKVTARPILSVIARAMELSGGSC
jgi:hypothetical protein